MNITPTINPRVPMPEQWGARPEKLRVSVTGLNEFGMPLYPRGVISDIPSDPAGVPEFAANVAEMVRKTVLVVLGQPEPEPKEGEL